MFYTIRDVVLDLFKAVYKIIIIYEWSYIYGFPSLLSISSVVLISIEGKRSDNRLVLWSVYFSSSSGQMFAFPLTVLRLLEKRYPSLFFLIQWAVRSKPYFLSFAFIISKYYLFVVTVFWFGFLQNFDTRHHPFKYWLPFLGQASRMMWEGI